MSFRIVFLILLLVFKALNAQAPAYICDLLTPYEPDPRLRSSSRALLMVPKSRLITKGGRAFAVRAPRLWNSLPADLRQANSVSPFIVWLFLNCYYLNYFICYIFFAVLL